MIVFAHRGDHRIHDQNTMAAFEAAIRADADGIETDLRTTVDDRIVLFHDHAVDGVPVASMTLELLRRTTGIDVPTLEDARQLAGSTSWNLEIKTTDAWMLARTAIATWPGGALVTSFVHAVAHDAAAAGMDAGLLIAHSPHPCRMKPPRSKGPATLVQDWKVATAAFAHDARAAGWRYGAYGMADDREHRELAREWGADIAITDDVPAAIAAGASDIHPESPD